MIIEPALFLSPSLYSGKLDDYWRVLREAGNLNAEKMAKFQNPITATPLHLPGLVNGQLLLYGFFC